MKKTLLSLLLALVMLTTLLPISVLAVDAPAPFGDSLYWQFDAESGALTISGSGTMPDFTYPGAPWQEHKAQILSVSLEAGVTSIGSRAFYGHTALSSVSLADSIASIGSYAFSGCSALTEVIIPASITALEANTFAYCSSLQQVTFPAGLTSIGNECFTNCSSLTAVTLPAELITIGHAAFNDCSALQTVTLPDTLTTIGSNAFNSCSALEAIALPNSVTELGSHAFYRCAGLTEVTIPESVTAIPASCFAQCTGLLTVTLPATLQSVGSFAFNACPLKSVIYGGTPEQWAAISIENGNTALTDTYAASIPCVHDPLVLENIDPTCTDAGLTEGSVCILCGEILAEQTEIAPLGHSYKNGSCTRCGESDPNYAPTYNPFKDVSKDAYYYNAVLWAVDQGITEGTTANTFSPDATCTRAQAVTFLWRAYGCPAPTSAENPFKDVSSDAYYYNAVLWAVEKGIAMGTAQDKFSPNSPCTRAHVVTFLWRAEGRPLPIVSELGFYDNLLGTYHFTAVLWAADQGITDGVDTNHFAPYRNCTRAHIVTFLYRAMAK